MTNEELRKILAAATPPPWRYDGMHNEISTPQGESYWLIVSECQSAPDQTAEQDKFSHHFDANFALIAALRNEAERLLNDSDALADCLKGGI